MFKFSNSSIRNQLLVHPTLVRLNNFVIKETPIDIGIIQGARTHDYQAALWAQGRNDLTTVNRLRAMVKLAPITAKENERPVTWTMASKHLVNPRTGYGHAIDFGVYINGKYINGDTDDEIEHYKTVVDIYLTVAKRENIAIVVGALWAKPDWGHIELDEKVYG